MDFTDSASIKRNSSSSSESSPSKIPKPLEKYEFIDGKRQGSRLIHVIEEQQIYKLSYHFPKYDHYKCYVSKCSASVNLSIDGVLAKGRKPHTHQSQFETVNVLKTLLRLKEACANPSLGYIKIHDIYKTIVGEDRLVPKELNFKRICRSLFRIRERSMGNTEGCAKKGRPLNQPRSSEIDGESSLTIVKEEIDLDDEPSEGVPEVFDSKFNLSWVKEEPVEEIQIKEEIEDSIDYECDFQPTVQQEPEPIETPSLQTFDVFEFPRLEICADETSKSHPMPFEFIEGKRKTGKLVHVLEEDQVYRLKSRYNEGSYYKCYLEKKCNIGIKIKDGSDFCFRTTSKSHTHERQSQFIKELKMVAEIKAECLDPSNYHKSLNQILQKYDTGDPRDKVVFARIARNLKRIRKNVLDSSENTN